MDRTRTLTAAAGAAWLLAGLVFLIAEGVAAMRFTPGYSYATNFISELGVVGCVDKPGGVQACSPLGEMMNAAFMASGLLFGLGVILASTQISGRGRILLLALGVAHAVGLVLVGVFHGGAFVRQDGADVFHVLGAFTAIVCGNVAIATAPVARVFGAPAALRRLGPWAAAAGLAGLLVLTLSGAAKIVAPPGDGAWERLSVYTITLWEVLMGGWLLFAQRPAAAIASPGRV